MDKFIYQIKNDPKLRGIIGGYCKAARQKKNISQAQLGVMVNMDKGNIGRIERGESLPELTTIIKLLSALEYKSELLHMIANQYRESQE